VSEYLLLSVFTRYLETQGYKVERRVALDKGAGITDILATKGRKRIFAEARWIKSEGDVFEALSRSVLNKQAYPKARHILVLEKGATSEELELSLYDSCWKNHIEINFVDINDREVFNDILSVHVFPALRKLIKKSLKAIGTARSEPEKRALVEFLSPLSAIKYPKTLVTDIKAVLKKLGKN
jgi:hypothetical protein